MISGITARIAVQITYEGLDEPRRIWLTLPANEAQFARARESVGAVFDSTEITDYYTNIPGLTADMLMKGTLSQANHLAARLDKLEPEDFEKLAAIAGSRFRLPNVEAFLHFSYITEKYILFPDVFTAEALGRRYIGDPEIMAIPQKHRDCIDPISYGSKLAIRDGGCFTPVGYLTLDTPVTPREHSIPARWQLTDLLGREIYGRFDDMKTEAPDAGEQDVEG